MKYIRILLVSLFFIPFAARAASPDFMIAAQLLAAAKSADIQQVQSLINAGANVNFVDSTGLSIVCTALMNNDVRAAQILQMYGADASQCDRQIKNYNNRTKPKGSGGLFSGLSSAHTMTLAAAGAAVVVGGLLLFTDVFDPDNGNDSGSVSTGTRPGGNGDGSGGSGGSSIAYTLPYGPAMINEAAEAENYENNLNLYAQGVYENIFALMNASADFPNYLLLMHGYSPLARGYNGMRTLRYPGKTLQDQTPFPNTMFKDYNFGALRVEGGRPVGVALVTANGVNAANKPAGELTAQVNSLDDSLVLWTTPNGDKLSSVSANNISSKYYNNKITLGASESVVNATTAEDATRVDLMDVSGFGTAVNNTGATVQDDMLAKVIGGSASGFSVDSPDFIGFAPYSQMAVFRTGAGTGMVAVDSDTASGTYTVADATAGLATGDTIVLFGKTLTVTRTGNAISATDGTDTYNGYISMVGTDNLLYISSTAGGSVNQAYEMVGGNLTLVRQSETIDYQNFKALRQALTFSSQEQDSSIDGRSKIDVYANLSVIAPTYSGMTKTISDILGGDDDDEQARYVLAVNQYYNQNETDGVGGTDYLPSTDAVSFFGSAPSFNSLVLFPAGREEKEEFFGAPKEATFENSAPLVFDNLENLFMTVVAVSTGDNTASEKKIYGYEQDTPFQLATWADGTTGAEYRSRICGVAGTGGGIDPWCFASVGTTDELAVASAAGAVTAVKSAFYRGISNKQVFQLLALTADGPFLATNTQGDPMSQTDLIKYLQGRYVLPDAQKARVDAGEDYLEVFKEVFGYGVMNLERATKPGTSVFYYNGNINSIVAADGKNSYWRSAMEETNFHASSVLNVRGATISAPFYDVLESVDGSMSLPRVWKNEFAMGADDSRALYMGDVLGEFKTRRDTENIVKVGNIGFSMAMSEKAYIDNLNGLDKLALSYNNGNWNLGASFQRNFTDGESRFNGLANPVLGLATNAVVTDVEYSSGKWSFGGRVFNATITDEGLLENDPTISSQYTPARLGLMQGAQSSVAWADDGFKFIASVGNARESDTLLGAQTGGFLEMGAGNTTYIDALASYDFSDNVSLMARATFARTTSNADAGMFIMGLTDIESNAFALGLNAGGFEFTVAQPLAITDGALQYAYADYDVVEVADNKFDLVVRDAHVADLALAPEKREVRFTGTYRHKFGEFTDGAVGFIYRVNPNHTDAFGDESIFMMKMTHRIGI